eukprot:2362118-Rhodomonas_salina.2
MFERVVLLRVCEVKGLWMSVEVCRRVCGVLRAPPLRHARLPRHLGADPRRGEGLAELNARVVQRIERRCHLHSEAMSDTDATCQTQTQHVRHRCGMARTRRAGATVLRMDAGALLKHPGGQHRKAHRVKG